MGTCPHCDDKVHLFVGGTCVKCRMELRAEIGCDEEFCRRVLVDALGWALRGVMGTRKLLVTHAANMLEDGRVFSVAQPGRHHDVIRLMCAELKVTTLIGYEQTMESGFLLSDGRFCRRKPAALVAFRAGQLIKERLKLRGRDPEAVPDQLYSEDVW